MASSGTYAFTVTRDDIIGAALRTLGAYGAADTIPAADLTNCAQALNILMKAMVMRGMPLWTVNVVSFPVIVGQAVYNLGLVAPTPGTNTSLRPLKLLDAWINDVNGNDVSLTIESRYDYDKLGFKTQGGIPNQLFYDPQIQTGQVTLYNVPLDTSKTVFLVIQRQIQDVNIGTDNLDFPQEFFQVLKWALADELALEYASPEVNLTVVMKKAAAYMEEAFGFEQEAVSVFFQPTVRRNS